MRCAGEWLLAGILILGVGCGAKETGVTLTWAVGKDATGTNRKLVEMFKAAHPGIKIRMMSMPLSSSAQHDAYVIHLIARDRTVDVYTVDIIWPGEFAAARWLHPLDEWFTEDQRQSFLPGPVAGCRYQGKQYALPWFMSAGALYYRKDLLDQHGYAPPRTWDDLLEQSRTLSAKHDFYGFVFQGQQYEGLVCAFLEFLWGNGGEVFDETGAVVLDAAPAVEALQFMVDLIHKYELTPPGITTYKEEETRQLFTNGDVVFLRNWPYVWAIAQDPAKGSKVAGNVGIAPMPGHHGGSASTLGGWNLAISAYSRHPAEAWQFIQFLAGAEAQKAMVLASGRLPTRHAIYRDADVLEFAPHYADFYEVFVNARPRPAGPAYPEISDAIQIGVHKALTQKATPEDALREAAQRIREIVGRE